MAKHILIFVTIVLTGCIFFRKLPNYTFADEPFELAEYCRYKNCLLDTNAFYYRKYLLHESDTLYLAKKFFSNGRVQSSSFHHFPSQVELDTTKNQENKLDYYKIEKGVLNIEGFYDRMYGMVYWEGNLYSDSLVFFLTSSVSKEVTYKKYPLPIELSDW